MVKSCHIFTLFYVVSLGHFVCMILGTPRPHYLLIKGCMQKIISERLGHAYIRTTMNIYGHALQTADQAAANKFDSLLI